MFYFFFVVVRCVVLQIRLSPCVRCKEASTLNNCICLYVKFCTKILVMLLRICYIFTVQSDHSALKKIIINAQTHIDHLGLQFQ